MTIVFIIAIVVLVDIAIGGIYDRRSTYREINPISIPWWKMPFYWFVLGNMIVWIAVKCFLIY